MTDDALARAKRALQLVPRQTGAVAPVDRAKVNDLIARAREAASKPSVPAITEPRKTVAIEPARPIEKARDLVPAQRDRSPASSPVPASPEAEPPVLAQPAAPENAPVQTVYVPVPTPAWGWWWGYPPGVSHWVACRDARRRRCPVLHGEPCYRPCWLEHQ